MVALIILTPEEYEVASWGSIDEPSFRPFPGSRRALELEEHFERIRAAEDVDEESEEQEEQLDVPCVALPGTRTMPRAFAAHRWRESTREVAVFLDPPGSSVVAIGSAYAGRRSGPDGVRAVTLRFHFAATEPIQLSDVLDLMPSRHVATIRSVLRAGSRPLPPAAGTEFLAALGRRSAEGLDAVGSVRTSIRDDRISTAMTRRPRAAVATREAMSSAVQFFAPFGTQLQPVIDPSPSPFAVELETTVNPLENDFIQDDSNSFPEWDRSTHSYRGWWEFRHHGRRLLVKNINVSPQENQSGADLVYVRRDPDSFVLVQYKVLTMLADGTPIFRPDGRLGQQVDRMLDFESSSVVSTAATPDDYRLGAGFSFVKFVMPNDTRPERAGQLTPGSYFPAEFMKLVLANPGGGPDGGVVHYIRSHRSLPSDTFARMVRDLWVGSTGQATQALRELFGFEDDDPSLVLAVDEPLPEPLPE